MAHIDKGKYLARGGKVMADEAKQETKTGGCPCVYVEPCHPRCTCVLPASSSGCRRCCRYGSIEQRTRQAEHLVAALEASVPTPGAVTVCSHPDSRALVAALEWCPDCGAMVDRGEGDGEGWHLPANAVTVAETGQADELRALVERLAQSLRDVAHYADFGQGPEMCWCKSEDEDDDAHTESLTVRAVLADYDAFLARLDAQSGATATEGE